MENVLSLILVKSLASENYKKLGRRGSIGIQISFGGETRQHFYPPIK